MTEMTFDLYATGQYAENYGAHDWDGEGQCPQYWKMKGSGEVLAMQNVTLANLPEAIKEVEARLSELGQSMNREVIFFCHAAVTHIGNVARTKIAIQITVYPENCQMKFVADRIGRIARQFHHVKVLWSVNC